MKLTPEYQKKWDKTRIEADTVDMALCRFLSEVIIPDIKKATEGITVVGTVGEDWEVHFPTDEDIISKIVYE